MKYFFLAAQALMCTSVAVCATTVDTTKIYPIDEIAVTTYRSSLPLRDAPNKVEVITLRDIRTVSALNVADLVKKSSNADAVDMQGLTGGIDFRGFAPVASGTNSYTRLLVDGLPMSTRNASATSLQNIASIEILKGPFSASFGSGAMGGVVNLVTPQTRGRLAGGATVGFGSFNTLNGNVFLGGNVTKKLDFDLHFDLYNQNKDYKTGRHNTLHNTAYEKAVLDPNSYGMRYDNTRYDKKAGGLRLGYDLNTRWRLNLHNDFYYTGNGRANGMLWGMYEQTDKKVFRNSHRLDLTGKEGVHTLRFSPYYSMEKSHYNNDFGYMKSKSRYDYQTWGAQIQDAISLGDHTLIVGVDNFSQAYNSRQWTEAGALDAPFQPNYDQIQTGVFVQGNLSFFKNRLTAVAGVRYDNILLRTFRTEMLDVTPDSKSFHTVNPNIALKYKIFKNLWVRGSAGSAFQAPDAFKLTGEYEVWGTRYKGNSGLKSEKSFTYDFGVGFSDNRRAIVADVSLFSTDHDNLIVSDYSFTSEGYVTYTNANSAKVRGLEYMFSTDFGRLFEKNYSLRLYASFTHIFKSEVIKPTGREEKKYIARNNANFGLDFAYRRLSARVNARYVGSKLEDNWIYQTDYETYQRTPFVFHGQEIRATLIDDNTVRLPNYMVFDFYVDYRVWNNLTVSVKVNNFLDENYMERDGYYMMGRNFSLQASFRF